MLNIVFMGTPDFAKESLEAIYEEGHNILAVITKEDRQQGRGMKIIENPVKIYSKSKGIKVYQPTKIKNNSEIINIVEELKPDIICVVAYGKILPKQILDIPKLGCINVHGSLLPKYRGAAPIQWAVINGDKTTGITTMYMDENMDTGDIILKQEVEIGIDETTGELWRRLSKIGGELLVETLEKIENGNAPRIKQGQEFSLAPMLDKNISKIDWKNQTSSQIINLARGLDPIMGIYSIFNGRKVKLWKIKIKNDFEGEINDMYSPGTVIYVNDKVGLYIKTIDGIIEVSEIQAENSKRMNILEFLRGTKIAIGEKFE